MLGSRIDQGGLFSPALVEPVYQQSPLIALLEPTVNWINEDRACSHDRVKEKREVKGMGTNQDWRGWLGKANLIERVNCVGYEVGEKKRGGVKWRAVGRGEG